MLNNLCCLALTGLPLPDKHESLLAEMLFSQMLRLPAAPFKPLAYSALMARFPQQRARHAVVARNATTVCGAGTLADMT